MAMKDLFQNIKADFAESINRTRRRFAEEERRVKAEMAQEEREESKRLWEQTMAKERPHMPVNYYPKTAQQFESIVRSQAKRIRRISKVSVDLNTAKVYCTVESQSGISDWNFKLDFDDYGKLTGRCWWHMDNTDSNIPKRLVDLIREQI